MAVARKCPPLMYQIGETMIRSLYVRLRQEINKVYIGDDDTLRVLICALIGGGHVLIEGLPGLAKTTLARTLAQSISGGFKRIQFTSDLMPSDITGSSIYRMNDGSFNFIPGPIFTHILLADELNRAPAKTQSALLEAMQERQVTVDARTYALKHPFMVLATQNTDEEYGTYPLPESQLDRFMFSLQLKYPSFSQELQILQTAAAPAPKIETIMTPDECVTLSNNLENIMVNDNIMRYIVSLVRTTREDPRFVHGISPRGGATLLRAAQTFAMLRGRTYVTPDDVKWAAPHVFRHRLRARGEQQLTVEQMIAELLTKIKYT